MMTLCNYCIFQSQISLILRILCQVAVKGLNAIGNIALNDGNREALRVHIDTIIGVLQGHASNAEVREADLETVICHLS